MKIKNYLGVIIVVLILSSCKKENKPLTMPVDFTATSYENLCPYDASGIPTCLLPKDSISEDMLSYIKTTLAEKVDLRTTHPEFLASSAIGDITITKHSDVFITFVSEVTQSRNALAFYTYPTNNPPATPKDIKTIVYAFPNIGVNTKLPVGAKVKIGSFENGTSIGFVLLKNAWDPITRTLDNTAVHFCSNDVLNPEVNPSLKKHVVLINYVPENKVLVGFENTDRTTTQCDHDFNDVVVYVTVK